MAFEGDGSVSYALQLRLGRVGHVKAKEPEDAQRT